MSIDWTTICDKCKKFHHLGQHMGGALSFGYGYQDEAGRLEAAQFIDDHIGCVWNDGEYLKIVKTDNIPTDYKCGEATGD